MTDTTEGGEQPQAEVEQTEQVLDQSEEQTEAPEPEFDEIEYEGAKHQIPKALKPAFLMQSDYTRKTQEVAEARKAVESEREGFKKTVERERQLTAEIGRVKIFDETLEQYQKLDWAAFRAQDPDKANATFQDYVQLKDQREHLAQKVSLDLNQRHLDEQREYAKRVEEGHQVLAKDIPGWGQEMASKLATFAKSGGLTEADVAAFQDNPRMVKLLHSAWLGSQVMEKQKAAAQAPAKEPDTPVQPLKQIARKPSGAARPGLHDGLSIDEWMRRANGRKSA